MSQRVLLPRSAPAASGVSSSAISSLLDRLDEKSIECHSLMVVRHGHVVAEGWWAPYSADRPHLLYSLTKSFTSIAVGLAIADGLLSLGDRVVDVLLDHVPAGISEQGRRIAAGPGRAAGRDRRPARPLGPAGLAGRRARKLRVIALPPDQHAAVTGAVVLARQQALSRAAIASRLNGRT